MWQDAQTKLEAATRDLDAATHAIVNAPPAPSAPQPDQKVVESLPAGGTLPEQIKAGLAQLGGNAELVAKIDQWKKETDDKEAKITEMTATIAS